MERGQGVLGAWRGEEEEKRIRCARRPILITSIGRPTVVGPSVVIQRRSCCCCPLTHTVCVCRPCHPWSILINFLILRGRPLEKFYIRRLPLPLASSLYLVRCRCLSRTRVVVVGGITSMCRPRRSSLVVVVILLLCVIAKSSASGNYATTAAAFS